MLVGTVLGANEVTTMQSHTTVNSDGSCQVALTVNIKVDSPVDALTFPLPGNASNVTLNGTSVRAQKNGSVRTVDLKKLFGGGPWESSLTFHYTLANALTTDEDGRYFLNTPILCGFAFPVEHLEFTVTLPGEFSAQPIFSSGYHQESIEGSMTYTVNGAKISGIMMERLLDRETLEMTLQLPQELIPTVAAADKDNPFSG